MDNIIDAAASLFHNSNFSAIVNGAGTVANANPAPEELEAEQDAIRYEKELAQMLETEFDGDDNSRDIGDESDCTAAAMSLTVNSFHSSAINNVGATIDTNSRANYISKRHDGYNRHLFENKSNGKRISKMDNGKGRIDANYDIDNNIGSRCKHSNVLSPSPSSKNYPTCSPTTMAEFEQLKVQYDVRMREIENLRSEKSELFEGLNRAKLETQQAVISRNEIQKMLVEATSRITDTEKELSISRQKCYTLEQVNSNTLHELEMCKSTIRELEERLLVAGREKNFDKVLNDLTSEHTRQLSSLQNELHISNNKLKSKEIDLVKLEQQLLDLRAVHESTLNENDELNGELQKLRRWFDCHSLGIGDSDTDKDKLQHKIKPKIKQRLPQSELDTNFNIENECATSNENNDRSRTSDRMLSSTLLPASSNPTAKLEEELRNAATNVKEKQTEIRLLEEKLFASSKLVKSLKNAETKFLLEIESLKKENEKLMGELKECEQQREMLKICLTDYATKSDILHREQMSALELEFSKRVVELETEIATCERRVKEAASKIFTEEIDRITNVYSDHFDNMTRSIEHLKTQLVDQSTRLEQMSAIATAADKLKKEIEKIYQKYTNARKIALQLKQLTEDRNRSAKRQREQYVQTLNEIQRYLDNALTNAGIVSTVIPSIATAADVAIAPTTATTVLKADTIKLAELIEKSKNTVHSDEPSIINDQLLHDLTRRLSNLEK